MKNLLIIPFLFTYYIGIGQAAGGSTFMNINCVDLVKFEELEGEYDLILKAPFLK